MIVQYTVITVVVLAAAAYLVHRLLRWGASAQGGCGDAGCRCGPQRSPDDERRLPTRRETIQLGGPKPPRDET